MPLPAGGVPVTNVDAGADSAAQARLDLKNLIDQFNQLIQAFGGASGACDLDANALVPIARLPGVTISGATDQAFAAASVAFPATQVASADPNTLDDYEEGTWTPVLTFGGANVGASYSSQIGHYTKIGRLVVLVGTCTFSNKGTSVGQLFLQGLPYLCQYAVPASVFCQNISYSGSIISIAPVSSSYLKMHQIAEAGSVSNITDAQCSNASSVSVSMSYFV